MTTFSGILKEMNTRFDAYAERSFVYVSVVTYSATRMYLSDLTNNVDACIESNRNVRIQAFVVIL